MTKRLTKILINFTCFMCFDTTEVTVPENGVVDIAAEEPAAEESTENIVNVRYEEETKEMNKMDRGEKGGEENRRELGKEGRNR